MANTAPAKEDLFAAERDRHIYTLPKVARSTTGRHITFLYPLLQTTAPIEGAAPTEAAPVAQKPAVVRKVVVRKGTQGVVKKLVTGAIAGAFSRSAVAPLETIRTHLMVGRGGSVPEVFARIMQEEGWKGLFRGNGINVLRVAPSKAIEVRV